MKKIPVFFVAFALPLWAYDAVAQDRATCLNAAGEGQTLRDEHKLVEARDRFRVCAAATCPSAVQTDCAGWFNEVDRSIPTIVLAAKDETGNDVFDVHVSLDGAPLTAKLDGTSLPMDPGPHTFRFAWLDGASTDRVILVREGQKDTIVTAQHPPKALQIAPNPVAPELLVPAMPTTSTRPNGLRTAGFVLAGTGLAAAAVGSVFGILTFSEASHAKSECGSAGCGDNTNPSAVSDMHTARTYGNVSTATFISGGALVAVGAVFIWRGWPKKEQTASSWVPVVTAHGAMLGWQTEW
jgi:hypothetical protein